MSQEVIEITEREIEVIEVVERGPSGPTGPQANINYTVVSSPQTLSNSQNIAADTSGGTFTLTLPLNPNEGDSIDIFDYSETFDTNPLTIARNGQRIESLEENLICNVEGAYFTMIYTGSTRGWQILPRYGTSGGGGESILTNQGDTLYRGPLVNERLPIGSAGQILKVAASGIPEWGNESGAVTSVNGATGAVTVAALNHTHEAADVFFQGLELLDAGNANTNGVYVYGGVFGGKGIYYKDKDSFIYWDGAAWMVSYNSDDIYSSAQNTTTPWQVTSWSVEAGQTSPAPSSWDRLTGDQWEAVVGQRINPTLRGTAAGKNVGTGADDVSAGNHTHGNLTNAGAIGTTANLPLRTGTNGVVEAGSFGAAAGSFCAGDDARLSDDRDPNAHAASHAAAMKAFFTGTVSGAPLTFSILADNVGTAGNSISFSFNGSTDIDSAVNAWNAANPSNTVSLSGDGTQVPSNGQTITLSGGVNLGSDPLVPVFTKVTISDDDSDESVLSLTKLTQNIIEFATQELSINHIGGNDTPYISVSDGTDEALLGLRQGEMFLQGSNPNVRIEQNGGNLANILMASAKLVDEEGPYTATIDVQEQLTDDVTLTIPDQSGTLAVVTDIPTTAGDVGAVAAGAITTSGLTQATARILGRTTASTGAIEEIQIGAGLSLSAGGLSATGGGGEVRSDFVSPYTYTGLAAAGTSESTASWTIRRSEFDAGGSYVATLTASAVQWANRLTASYT